MADLKITLHGESGLYQILKDEGFQMHIYPVGEPDYISTIIQDQHGNWSVEGSDEIYEFEFYTPESMAGYPYPPLESWSPERQAELDEFLNGDIGTSILFDLPAATEYSSVDIPFPFRDDQGTNVSPEEVNEWFKNNYDRYGFGFTRNIFKALTSPLLGDRASQNLDLISRSNFTELFAPGDSEVPAIEPEDSTFPEPPISMWTDQQQRDLYDLLKLMSSQGPGALTTGVRNGRTALPLEFTDILGEPLTVKSDFIHWFVHFFNQDGRDFSRDFYRFFSTFEYLKQKLDRSPVVEIFE